MPGDFHFMIKFEAVTIFPKIFKSYLGESLIARAQKKKLIKVNVHDLRKWGKGPHKQVDDRPFGGGLGMVMQVEPIYKAIKKIKKHKENVTYHGQFASQKVPHTGLF